MSMLRNVLTYMGLGPDEDYDDGYLYEAADEDIDLTDEFQGRTSRRSSSDDPHAQRERPRWLDGSTTSSRGAAPAAQPPAPMVVETVPQGRSAGRHDAAPARTNDHGRPKPLESDADRARPRDDSFRPLRAVPPAETEDEHESNDGITVRSVDDTQPATAPGSPASGTTVKPRALSPQSFGDAKELADAFKADVPVIMNLQGVDRQLARRLIDFASGICYAMDGSMEKIASQVFLLTPTSVEVSEDDRRRLEARRYDQERS